MVYHRSMSKKQASKRKRAASARGRPRRHANGRRVRLSDKAYRTLARLVKGADAGQQSLAMQAELSIEERYTRLRQIRL